MKCPNCQSSIRNGSIAGWILIVAGVAAATYMITATTTNRREREVYAHIPSNCSKLSQRSNGTIATDYCVKRMTAKSP